MKKKLFILLLGLIFGLGFFVYYAFAETLPEIKIIKPDGNFNSVFKVGTKTGDQADIKGKIYSIGVGYSQFFIWGHDSDRTPKTNEIWKIIFNQNIK
ncbi:MAG: hypothetical protein AAB824_00165, partial [Patescibacteria group bacterium]